MENELLVISRKKINLPKSSLNINLPKRLTKSKSRKSSTDPEIHRYCPLSLTIDCILFVLRRRAE